MGGVSFLEAAPIFKTNVLIGLWITLDKNPENMFLLFLAFFIYTFAEEVQTKHTNSLLMISVLVSIKLVDVKSLKTVSFSVFLEKASGSWILTVCSRHYLCHNCEADEDGAGEQIHLWCAIPENKLFVMYLAFVFFSKIARFCKTQTAHVGDLHGYLSPCSECILFIIFVFFMSHLWAQKVKRPCKTISVTTQRVMWLSPLHEGRGSVPSVSIQFGIFELSNPVNIVFLGIWKQFNALNHIRSGYLQ